MEGPIFGILRYLSFHHNKQSHFKVSPGHFCRVEYILNWASLHDHRLPVATLNAGVKTTRNKRLNESTKRGRSS